MKKLMAFLATGLIVSTATFAQSTYKNAIGVRVANTYYDLVSFSYKGFVTKQGALEVNAGFGTRSYFYDRAASVSASLSYQHHFNIKPVPGLRWFVGGGFTLTNSFSDYKDYDGFGFGLFPTGGIDYKFSKIPLAVSADVRPTVFVSTPGYYNNFYGNVGVAARYTFK